MQIGATRSPTHGRVVGPIQAWNSIWVVERLMEHVERVIQGVHDEKTERE
jgi:hypothetical protein